MPPFNTDLSTSSCDGSITTMSSFNSCIQDESTSKHSNLSTVKKIKKLNAEVRKLKAIADFTKAEAEETISEEMEEISKRIDEQRMALTAAKIAKNQLKVKIESKDDFIRFNEKCIIDKENELQRRQEERIRMEEEMNYLMNERERLIRKMTELESIVSSVSKAMGDLYSEQEKIIASARMMENEFEKQSAMKIDILRQYLEYEIQQKNESRAIRVTDSDSLVSGSSSKMNLIDAMKHQQERMRATLIS